MFFFTEQQPEFDKLSSLGKKLTEQITQLLKPTQQDLLIPAGEHFLSQFENGGIYLIKSGIVFLADQERRLFGYEEGELILITPGANDWPLKYYSELAIVVDHYLMQDLSITLSKNESLNKTWLSYLQAQIQMISLLFAAAIEHDPVLEPGLEYIDPDQVIMRQGELEKTVYTMVEGSADVFVDGVKVGQIKREEIFGAFSCLTNAPRSATVVATSRCLVAKLPKESFLELITARPHAALQLLQEMAETITSLNQKVVHARG